ncbi:MAG: hypothetical protein GTO45_20415 [Candidatus Aminicenantes bacterium]|nr:hypothetical protein [Candidatus Aminicenantes bacterium]NIM81159.1 hypothetical protein [Candidatus Aminicenantes bacterium]NIN20533.1 hypothetical protein [Candidatus Aminicenantes bacterium]NIN44306.1 hypothetical protein [Candidatus Aminicenantes bacterium]NIN87125.1 hypothetical protein [Candidatus Aminicenantes bacterium]
MKKIIIFISILFLSAAVFASEIDFSTLDIKVGYITIPRPFIHAKKDYDKGIYYVTLTAKEGVPYFNVHNQKKELLFEELAVVKPTKSKYKFNYRVRKGFLKGYEYFKLKVMKPEANIFAFFLVKKEKEKQVDKEQEKQ